MNRTSLILLLITFCLIESHSQTEYILGVIEYERKYGTELEKVQSRKSGYAKISNEAKRGNSDAQYYLANILLSDTIYVDSTKAIEFLKKSAFQRNDKAIQKLDELGVTEYEVRIDFEFWKKIGYISSFLIVYLILSVLTSNKINKSRNLTSQNKKYLKRLSWLFPIIGAIIGLRKCNAPVQTIDKDDIDWIIESFEWIKRNFPKGLIDNTIIKTSNDFSHFKSNLTKKDAKKLVQEISSMMDIEKGKIIVDFYKERQHEAFDEIEIRQFEDVESSTGKYFGMNNKGKYHISLEENLLTRPTNLIATIAHELAHIKLLGENRISENDEYLTDLIPIAYGFGIFGANSIFNMEANNYYWSMNRQGYLDEKTYGFALAWFSNLKDERNPIWKRELKPTMLSEFEKNMIYIQNEIKQVTLHG